jgi:hypothetical protein
MAMAPYPFQLFRPKYTVKYYWYFLTLMYYTPLSRDMFRIAHMASSLATIATVALLAINTELPGLRTMVRTVRTSEP